MNKSLRAVGGAVGLFAAIGTGAFAYRSAHVMLPNAVRAGIARALGVEPGAVETKDVRLGWDGLVINELAAGPLAAHSVRYRPHMSAIFGGPARGELELTGLVVEDPPALGVAVDRVEIDRMEVTFDATFARVRAHGTRVVLAASVPSPRIAELGIEVDRRSRTARRIAFTGLDVGPLSGLGGGATLSGDRLALRAAGDGVRLSAEVDHGSRSLSVDLDRRTLAWQDGRTALPNGRVRLSGHIRAEGGFDAPLLAEAELTIEDGEVLVPRLAPDPLALAGTRLVLRGGRDDDHGHLDGELDRGALRIVFGGAIDEDGTLSAQVTLPRTGCRDTLLAMPPQLRRALDGIALDGDASGSVRLRVALDDVHDLSLDGDLANRCTVEAEPPLADAGRLRNEAPILPGATDADGRPRRMELGRANPRFRSFERIPARVVSTFVEAEDGRFWRHHGIDLSQISRALAHDLEVGAPGRGGSTITQQVVKNLFLSGERTFGRKLEEVVLAWRAEARLDKRRILELYLNLVELGPGIYGVSEGAEHWFHKDVDALTLDEAAQLAALLPAPRRGMDEAFHRRLEQLRARIPGLERPQHASR